MKVIDSHMHFHGGIDNTRTDIPELIGRWIEISPTTDVEKVMGIFTADRIEEIMPYVKETGFVYPVFYLTPWAQNGMISKELNLAQKQGIKAIKLHLPLGGELKSMINITQKKGFNKFHLHSSDNSINALLDLIGDYKNCAFHLAHGVQSFGKSETDLINFAKYFKKFEENNTLVNLGTSSQNHSYFPEDLQKSLQNLVFAGLEDNIAFETDITPGFFYQKDENKEERAISWYMGIRDDVEAVIKSPKMRQKIFYENAQRFIDFE